MDDEWSDPPLDPDSGSKIAHRRLSIRLACSFAALVVLVYLTRGFLDDAIVLLWPPTEPLGQWITFVLLYAFGYVIVPLMIGSVVADVLLERVLD